MLESAGFAHVVGRIAWSIKGVVAMVAEKVTVVDVSEVTMKAIVTEIGKQKGVRAPEAESAEDRHQDKETNWIAAIRVSFYCWLETCLNSRYA